MSTSKDKSRRSAIKTMAGSAALAVVGMSLSHRVSAAETAIDEKLRGRIKHSVCRWCYSEVPFEDLCKAANNIGITSIELIGPDEWPISKKYGLTCAMPNGAGKGLEYGFNDLTLHDELIKSYTEIIPKVASAGLKQIICFSGNRRGLDDQKGMENCAIGLKRLLPIAEKYKIILSMELLNSRVDHPDYQCDHSA